MPRARPRPAPGGGQLPRNFRASRCRAPCRAARDALAAQTASYQQVVLEAPGQVADAKALLGLASAQIQQYEDTAGLLVALGGGWWNDRIGGVPAGAVSQ